MRGKFCRCRNLFDLDLWSGAKSTERAQKTIDIIDALPRNASGKILRKDLRAPYWAGRDRQVN